MFFRAPVVSDELQHVAEKVLMIRRQQNRRLKNQTIKTLLMRKIQKVKKLMGKKMRTMKQVMLH